MRETTTTHHQTDFNEVYEMIIQAKSNAQQQINRSLIKLYWSIGGYVNHKIKESGWGKSVVEQLSHYLTSKAANNKDLSARNIWRMKQFFEMYESSENLSALLTEITWTNHLHIMSKTKSMKERESYMIPCRRCVKNIKR